MPGSFQASRSLDHSAAFYLAAFKSDGTSAVIHAITEYYSFIALVGGLFVVSGNILLRIRGTPSPLLNTTILAVGAVLANLVGPTNYVKALSIAANETYPTDFTQGVTLTVTGVAGQRTITFGP